jgi:hypothetical protein
MLLALPADVRFGFRARLRASALTDPLPLGRELRKPSQIQALSAPSQRLGQRSW